MRVLVTGGAGYIGSHTTLALLEAGHDVMIVDNLTNSYEEAVRRVSELAGREPELHLVDLLDEGALDDLFARMELDAVVHIAGLKAVGESVADPLRYYSTNIGGTLALLRVMQRHDVFRLVFSSSATVYGLHGEAEDMPLHEDLQLGAVNPYGQTKVHIEQILTDVAAADARWRLALLRYFNPVGAHPSGRIGEDPQGVPANLLPFTAQVAIGRRDKLVVFGDDYPTPDGTGVRDYIHVLDLAEGHLAALEHLDEFPGANAWNLGTGTGSSVLEVLHAFERAVGHQLPSVVADRRPGDAAVSYCDPSKAQRDLGWRASRALDEMCADHWRWQQQNPYGYRDPA
ncbi:MAG: UDP-glucose 4-epimerase GalE [Streptosporangiales bacterium]|nr:UDP-glucose 4-epimerase GalE [Streptosporangiales bacterium]